MNAGKAQRLTRRLRRLAVAVAAIGALVVVSACSSASSGPESSESGGPSTSTPQQTSSASAAPTQQSAAEPGPTASSADEPTGGVLRVAAPAEPPDLNPASNLTNAVRNVTINTFNSLLSFNLDTYELEPELATSWEYSDDGLTLTLKLRDDVHFHNGQAMTAADAAWSIEQDTSSSNNRTGPALVNVKNASAVDKYTVAITLKQKDYTIPSVLPDVYVWPDGWEYDVKDPTSVKGMGTGPFMLEKWVPNDVIVLKRNPNYWQKGYPKLDEVDFVHIGDATTAALQLKSAQLDMMVAPFAQVKSLDSASGVQVINPPAGRSGLYDLRINFKHKPWGDVRVRQALAYALDRTAIKQALLGMYDPVSNPIPPTSKFFASDAIQYSLNVAKAKELLAAAGYPDGVDAGTLMTHFELGPDFKILAELIQAQAAKVGIKLKVQSYDVPTFVKRLLDADFDIGLSQTLGRQTPYDLLQHDVGSVRASYGGFAEPLKDYLTLLNGIAQMDPNSAEYEATVKKAQVEAMEKLPVIIVGSRPQPVAITDKVQGFKAEANGFLILENVGLK